VNRPTDSSTPEPQPLQHKLAAILYADVAGYSRLTGEDEDGTHRVLSAYLDAFAAAIQAHHGAVKHYAGDAVLADFATVSDALTCAVAIQGEFKQRNEALPEAKRVQFRIGVNLGEVIVDRGEVYGNGVNVAARLESLAEPGGICVSGSVVDTIGTMLPLSYEYRGEHTVKNIDKPVRAYRVTEAQHGQRPSLSLRRRFRLMRTSKLAYVMLALLVVGIGISVYTLNRSPPTPARAGLHRIAVLPFTNLSADPENEYFADGITEEMISQLSKIRGLEVIARTSIMTYKGKDKKIDEIGRELRVGTVLEGSVRKAENQIRIAAQLIDVENQAHLWSQEYNREAKGIFAVQSDIAKSVAEALKVKLGASEQQRIEKKGTDNPEAHELYLKGLYHYNKSTKAGIAKSIEYYEQAIQKDPSYAEAYAWLAYAHEVQGWWGLVPEKEAFAKAKAMALKAVELDSSNAHALMALGDMTIFDWDWSRVESLYQRALSLAPNSAGVHQGYGNLYLSAMGRHEEAIAEVKRAVELDPLSPINHHELGWVLHNARQYDAAIEQFQKALQMESGLNNAYRGLGEIYAYKGMYDKSIEAMQNLVKTSEGSPYALASLGWAYGVAGKKEEALKILDTLKEKAKVQPVAPSDFARVYLGLGEKEQALFWLEKTYEERSGMWILVWANHFPFFDGLRAEPRFKALLKKIGLEK
jgi:adenylate cyclase